MSKKVKTPMNVHTPKSPRGSGDYYGSAIKAKVGRVREDFMGATATSRRGLSTPPKSLA